MTRALMHLDGCHFYVWVDEDGRLTYDERSDADLVVHQREDDCDRCVALARGAAPAHAERRIDPASDDAKVLMGRVFEAIVEIQEGTE